MGDHLHASEDGADQAIYFNIYVCTFTLPPESDVDQYITTLPEALGPMTILGATDAKYVCEAAQRIAPFDGLQARG